MKVKYRKIYVEVPGYKKGVKCECCGKIPKPRGINLHHWVYAYTTKEVRENPKLAIKNTSLLCFACHRIGDAIRVSLRDLEKYEFLLKLRSKAMTI